MFPIACYQATGQYFAHSALNDRFPAILNAQNPAIPSAHPQARMDFGAEIEFFDSNTLSNPASIRQDRIPIQLRPQFAQLKNLSAVFGPLESLKPPKMQSGNTGGNGRHAALAIITYFNVLNGEPCLSLLIYTKASVSGDEPLDILSYQVENTDFPHQGTQDQFFNEAQWESHRKLGEHIGKPVAQVVQTLIQGVLS